MSAAALATLAALPPGLVWQADRLARPADAGMPTGFAALDVQLPGGGWPRGALIELFAASSGIGELGLLLPLLRTVAPERWAAWIAPPYLPYAPALAAAGVPLDRLLWLAPADHSETLWTIRQAVASGGCGIVLAWLARADTAALRRLQLAAEESATPLFLFRPAGAAMQPSPAVLRLRLSATDEALRIDILKRRGPVLAVPISLPIVDRPGVDPARPAFRPEAHQQSTAPSPTSGERPAPSIHPFRPTHPTRSVPLNDPIQDAVVRVDPSRPAAAGLHARRG